MATKMQIFPHKGKSKYIFHHKGNSRAHCKKVFQDQYLMKKHFTICDGKTGQRGPKLSSKTAGCEINPPCALLDEQPKTERPQSCKFPHHKGKNKQTFPPKGNFKSLLQEMPKIKTCKNILQPAVVKYVPLARSGRPRNSHKMQTFPHKGKKKIYFPA